MDFVKINFGYYPNIYLEIQNKITEYLSLWVEIQTRNLPKTWQKC